MAIVECDIMGVYSNRECVTMEKFFIRVSDAIERVWQYKECDIRARVANTECGNA